MQIALLAAALFLVNLYICWGLFGIEYSRFMGSIEGAYIGISRYMLAHWHDYSWFPVWYAGIPSQNTYPPLLQWIVSFAAILGGTSTAHAYHWVTALLYCLGPVTLFAMILRLAGSVRAAFIAGALYSAISLSDWLIPSIGRENGILHPERLTVLISDGEGPHIAALALLPLAILFLDLALDRRRPVYITLAVLSVASVPLTNWIGAFSLALALIAYGIARLGNKTWVGDLGTIVLIGAAAYLVASPWIPPSTLAAVHANAKLVGGDYKHADTALLLWTPVILLLLLALKAILRRCSNGLQFAIFFTLLTALFPLASAWANVVIVPQPERYHLEMEMALLLLTGLVLDGLLRRLPPRPAIAGIAAIVVLLIWPVRAERRYARNWLLLSIDITTTSEWRTAQWLNQHWNGGRVMLPGSTAFWLTAFSDTPEIGGGFDQGLTIYPYHDAKYEIGTGEEAGSQAAQIAVLWLKALGVQAVEVSGAGSTEVYKEFHHPQEFEGVLQPLWRDRGDVLYSTGASPSLAHVLAQSDLVARKPGNGIDLAPLRPYVAALEDPQNPRATFHWTSLHSAQIQTNLPPNSVVSIQISWNAGWHARVNGHTVRVLKDGLGFLYIVPGTAGPASILIDYDGGIEGAVTRWACILTLALLGAAMIFSGVRSQARGRSHD